MMMDVEFYKRPNGERPAFDFLMSLDDKIYVKAIGTIRLLSEKGYALRAPYSKKIDENIFELRIEKGGNCIRVLYFFAKGNKAYLTNGFIKKQNKTPKEELERANKYYAEFITRKEGDS